MPRKVFVAGEILTAADVQEYLADQSVMTFASSAARGSAIGTAVEGMVTYLEDTDQLEVYGGTAVGWSSASNFLFGTAVPSDGQVVTYSTAVSGYVPQDVAAGGGKVLQVVQSTSITNTVTTSTSFVASSLTGTITPSSSSSKVKITVNANIQAVNANDRAIITIYRGDPASSGVNLASTSTNYDGFGYIFNVTTTNNQLPTSAFFLDAPATTSAITYYLAIKSQSGGSAQVLGLDVEAVMILEEIAG